jgi:hypothetical protein
MTQGSAEVIEIEEGKARTEPVPRNDCSDGLLGGKEGDGGRIKGDSSLWAGTRDNVDLGDADGVGVRVEASE